MLQNKVGKVDISMNMKVQIAFPIFFRIGSERLHFDNALVLILVGLFSDAFQHNVGLEELGLQPGGVHHHHLQKYPFRESESLKIEMGSQCAIQAPRYRLPEQTLTMPDATSFILQHSRGLTFNEVNQWVAVAQLI